MRNPTVGFLRKNGWPLALCLLLLILGISNTVCEAASQKSSTKLQYELITLNNSGGGHDVINVTPTSFSIVPNGKHVSFEISFVPSVTATPTFSWFMSSTVSVTSNGVSFNGTNDDGSANCGFLNTFPNTAFLGEITFVAQFACSLTNDLVTPSFTIQEGGAPLGKYFVKIFY